MIKYLLLYMIVILGGIYAFVHYRRLKYAFRWIGVYLFMAGLIQLTGYMLHFRFDVSNTGVLVFAIFAYHFILFMYFVNLPGKKSYRNIMIVLFILGLIGLLYFVLQPLPPQWLPVKAIIFGNLIYASSAILFLLGILRSPKAENPLTSSQFISLGAMLLYFSTSSVYFSVVEMFAGKISNALLVNFNLILLYVFYIALIYAIQMEIKCNKRDGI